MPVRDEFNPKEVDKLPIRYQVAFAARCVRRARPLFRAGDEITPDDEALVEKAIQSAEYFAADRPFLDLDDIAGEVSGVADRLARRRGDYRKNVAARVAFSAHHAAQAAWWGRKNLEENLALVRPRDCAAAAAGSMLEAIEIAEPNRAGVAVAAARADLAVLAALASAQASPLGDPIDTTEDGPLGPLWPGQDPGVGGR